MINRFKIVIFLLKVLTFNILLANVSSTECPKEMIMAKFNNNFEDSKNLENISGKITDKYIYKCVIGVPHCAQYNQKSSKCLGCGLLWFLESVPGQGNRCTLDLDVLLPMLIFTSVVFCSLAAFCWYCVCNKSIISELIHIVKSGGVDLGDGVQNKDQKQKSDDIDNEQQIEQIDYKDYQYGSETYQNVDNGYETREIELAESPERQNISNIMSNNEIIDDDQLDNLDNFEIE